MRFLPVPPALVLLLSLTICTIAAAQADWRQKTALEIQASIDAGKNTDALLIFSEKADLSGMPPIATKTERAQFVFSRLQHTAETSQARARAILRAQGVTSNSLCIANAIAVVDAPPAVLRQLAALPEIQYISPDPWVYFTPPTPEPAPTQRNSVEWGVERINAPAVWALGFTGQGVTVGGADTGYDWVHPAIKPHYRGWNNLAGSSDHNYNWHDGIHQLSPLNNDPDTAAWHNPCGLSISAPCDDQAHGTHTMGTMTGDDGMGNQIGVAPGAQWVGCRNMERGWGKPSSYLECFEWFLAPTDINNQNPDPSKAPMVINNSWYCSFEEGCTDVGVNELLRTAVINLRASGVVVVVSNGNFGQACATTYGPPAYFEESFSIGSFRSNDTLSGFSSRGPVTIDNSFRVKPNVTAPGSNIRSSTPNEGYSNFSGTSMAGPHVVGLVALLISSRPELAGYVDDIENIIEQSAIPTDGLADCSDNFGLDYPNNSYGYGRVDALSALFLAQNWTPTNQAALQTPARVDIYPNPVSDVAVFDLHFAQGAETLTLFSSDGRLVAEQKLHVIADRQIIRLPISQLTPGVYQFRINGTFGVLSGALIKQ